MPKLQIVEKSNDLIYHCFMIINKCYKKSSILQGYRILVFRIECNQKKHRIRIRNTKMQKNTKN
mgnify:CR=1 FL=1